MHLSLDAQRSALASLVQKLDLPVDHVERVSCGHSAQVESGARIKTFVPIVVAGRLRAELRRQRRAREVVEPEPSTRRACPGSVRIIPSFRSGSP